MRPPFAPGQFAGRIELSDDFGWGIGLVAHGVYVFLLSGRSGPEWEERQVRAEMERLRRARRG
ncbi:MAG: 2TM domain-containing protein [Chloroflexi bacterium]|nr:2TM domain-containing protein [Chloroflexota bacterium]